MKMAIISGTIKAETFTKSAGGSIVINTVDPEQLNRIEDKLDRIIELMGVQEQTATIKLDGKAIAEIVNRENFKGRMK